jgi:hypothetical protein
VPETIQQGLQQQPFIAQWYSWGVFVSCAVTLGVTIWLFLDARHHQAEAWLWTSLAVIASVFSVPAAVARLNAGFASAMRDSLTVLAAFSIAGGLLALIAAAAYAATKRRGPHCPTCGRPQLPTWSQCPYHSASTAIDRGRPLATEPSQRARNPVAIPAAEPLDRSRNAEPKTLVETPALRPVEPPERLWEPEPKTLVETPALRPAEPPQRLRETDPRTLVEARALGPPKAPESIDPAAIPPTAPRTLALLLVQTGPQAGTRIDLKEGVTRIGRDPAACTFTVADDAVSDVHLSLRHQAGVVTLTDLDSTDGTTVNGKRVHKRALASNDIIGIGGIRLAFIQLAIEPGNH